MSKIIRAEDAIKTARNIVARQVASNDVEEADELLYGFLKLFEKVIDDTPAVEEGVTRCPKCGMSYDEKYVTDDSCCYQCGSRIK